MKIIACLGNPGRQYERTRHNIGFVIGNECAGLFGIDVSKKIFSSAAGYGKVGDVDILMLFPQTFMNLSGNAVQSAFAFHKETPENLIVIHDEIELPFGEWRIKQGGGHKGHNGLRSIIQQCGSADFARFRFGVGRPENTNIEVADYVLAPFLQEESDTIRSNMPQILETLKLMIIK